MSEDDTIKSYCNLENKKGDIVTVYRYALKQDELDAEGEAELHSRIRVFENTERWWLRFKGENKFVQRTIAKKNVPPVDPKLDKLLDSQGGIRYKYKKMRDQQTKSYNPKYPWDE